jgi:vacuolar-type H+-ATPase subunit H
MNLKREFAHSTKRKGADGLLEIYEDALAMQALMSGMFDAKIKALKEEKKALAKHEYAIRTSEEVDAMAVEGRGLLDKARTTYEAAEKLLNGAEIRAKEIIQQAEQDAKEAINSRQVTLAETQKKADAIIAEGEKKAGEITAGAVGDLDRIKRETIDAQAILDDFLNKIRDANQEWTRINKAIEAEKSRVQKIFA